MNKAEVAKTAKSYGYTPDDWLLPVEGYLMAALTGVQESQFLDRPRLVLTFTIEDTAAHGAKLHYTVPLDGVDKDNKPNRYKVFDFFKHTRMFAPPSAHQTILEVLQTNIGLVMGIKVSARRWRDYHLTTVIDHVVTLDALMALRKSFTSVSPIDWARLALHPASSSLDAAAVAAPDPYLVHRRKLEALGKELSHSTIKQDSPKLTILAAIDHPDYV